MLAAIACIAQDKTTANYFQTKNRQNGLKVHDKPKGPAACRYIPAYLAIDRRRRI